MPASPERFRLAKWYLDLVADDGTTLIVYAASLRWRTLRVTYASTLLARPGECPVERASWLRARLPETEGDRLELRNDALRLRGEWRREARPVGATLLDDDAGRLDWCCAYPSATARVSLGDETLVGRGYAERLTMTRLPWTLPLRRLWWGRYASARHAAVWIAWHGGAPRQWVWLDGAAQPGAALGEDGPRGLDAGMAIHTTPVRDLCDRRALRAISRRLPALGALPLGPLRDLREVKRLRRATLSRDGAPVDHGWVIDEEVSW